MTLDAVIMLFGAFVAVLSFLQLPPEWNTVLFFVAGIVIIGLGILVRRRGSVSASAPMRPTPSSRFVDSQYPDDDHAEG